MEAKRKSAELPFAMWEPFIWEYSSAISTLLLLPLVIITLRVFPFNWQAIKRSIFQYFIAATIFSLLHVSIMVGLRKLTYFVVQRSYDFGDLWFELL